MPRHFESIALRRWRKHKPAGTQVGHHRKALVHFCCFVGFELYQSYRLRGGNRAITYFRQMRVQAPVARIVMSAGTVFLDSVRTPVIRFPLLPGVVTNSATVPLSPVTIETQPEYTSLPKFQIFPSASAHPTPSFAYPRYLCRSGFHMGM